MSVKDNPLYLQTFIIHYYETASKKKIVTTCLLLVQAEEVEEEEVVGAVRACSTLFCSLLQRREVFRGKVPGEEEAMCGASS